MPVFTPQFTDFETVEASMDTDEFGMATARVSYYAIDDEKMITLLRTGRICPFVTDGLMQSARFLHGSADLEDGVWKVSLFWKGAGAALRLNEGAVTSYKPIAQTSPIETHPNFEEFAGTQQEPRNNALFDGKNNFMRFPPLMEDAITKNPKSGVTNYYQATLKVGDNRVIEQKDIASESGWFAVGKLAEPEIDNLVQVDIGGDLATHLLTSVILEDLGNGFASLVREWDKSGPFGWDEDIYDYKDTGDASEPTC
jgi:hypothetical protein